MFNKHIESSYRVVLWGAWYGSRNVGDQALLLTITSLLEKELGEVRFTVLTDDPVHVLEYTANESCCKVNALQSRRQPGCKEPPGKAGIQMGAKRRCGHNLSGSAYNGAVSFLWCCASDDAGSRFWILVRAGQ